MKLPRFRDTLLIAAMLAAVMPAYCLIRHALDWRYLIGRIEILLWPTSIMLMATDGHEHTFGAYLVIAISIAANAVVYVSVFAAVWSVAWIIRASIRSLRDGTTI